MEKNYDVPEGAKYLFANYIHPAFRGTSVAFHTKRLLAHFAKASRDHAKDDGERHPYTHGKDLQAIARSILQGKRQTAAGVYGGGESGTEPRNPFKVIGEWFKKLRGDGVVSIPEHLHDLADRYNYDTADRRHSFDASMYDLALAQHGGDHNAADQKLIKLGYELLHASEDKKRALTAKLRQRFGTKDLPADWHTEILGSLHRLHQYALDREMFRRDAAHRAARRLNPKAGRPTGEVHWKDWFMGAAQRTKAGAPAKRGDPLRLSREHLPALLAGAREAQTRGDWLPTKVLSDHLEDHGTHYDAETLQHAREEGPHTIAQHPDGRVWIRKTPQRQIPQWQHDTWAPHGGLHVTHEAHGPGGHYVVTHIGDNGPEFSTLRKWGRDVDYPEIVSSRTTEGETGTFPRSHAHYVAAANELASRFPQQEPARLSRAAQGLGAALRELGSRNQLARERAAKALLREAGEPGAVASVIAHHPELGFRASVMATLATGDHYAQEAARYLGAWHGTLAKEPETVAFHAHEDGADKLHVIHVPTDPMQTAEALRSAGVQRFAIRPGNGRSTAFVYDQGGQ